MKVLCVPDSCLVLLSGNCVFYTGPELANSGITMNDTLTVALKKIDDAIGGTAGTLQAVTDNGNTTTNSLEITDSTQGLILKSPNGTRWKIQILNTGELIATSL